MILRTLRAGAVGEGNAIQKGVSRTEVIRVLLRACQLMMEIRKTKGMKPELPSFDDYHDKI